MRLDEGRRTAGLERSDSKSNVLHNRILANFHSSLRSSPPLAPRPAAHRREGIVITTVAQRDGKKIPLTAATMPCEVEVLESNVFRITLKEGRNRQIRKMCKELDLEVR